MAPKHDKERELTESVMDGMDGVSLDGSNLEYNE